MTEPPLEAISPTRPRGVVSFSVSPCTRAHVSDHIEGEAETARKQESFKDDGVIDKHEQKEIDRAHKRQLESRGRGMAQYKPYRSGKWMLQVCTVMRRFWLPAHPCRALRTECQAARPRRANVSVLVFIQCIPFLPFVLTLRRTSYRSNRSLALSRGFVAVSSVVG